MEDLPTQDEIAALAYARYIHRGSVDGHDLEDWFEAERELRQAALMARAFATDDPPLADEYDRAIPA